MYRRRRSSSSPGSSCSIGTFVARRRVGGAFKTEFKLPGTESQEAFDLLEQSSFRNRQIQAQIVFARREGIDDPEVQEAMEGLFAEIEEEIADVDVVSPYSEEGARQIGRNGQIAYAEVNFADRSNEELPEDGKEIKRSPRTSTSPASRSSSAATCSPTRRSAAPASSSGSLAAMIILLIAFGSVLAMGLPIVTALFGIGTGVAIVLTVRTVIDMPDFTTAAVAMIGIGVGIDYALFIVTRYREDLADGLDPERSVDPRRSTPPGRAVLFAGTTVVISLLGLLPHEDVDHARRGGRHRDRRAHHHARVGHAAAGAARLRRPQHRQVRPAAPQASPRARSASRSGTGGAA